MNPKAALAWEVDYQRNAPITHQIQPADRERVRCQKCGEPAFICHHDHWRTEHRSGVSFWNYCTACWRRRCDPDHEGDRGTFERGRR